MKYRYYLRGLPVSESIARRHMGDALLFIESRPKRQFGALDTGSRPLNWVLKLLERSIDDVIVAVPRWWMVVHNTVIYEKAP